MRWHKRMSPLYMRLEMEIIKLGGTVQTTQERYKQMPIIYQDALKYLSHHKRKEADRVNVMHILSPPDQFTPARDAAGNPVPYGERADRYRNQPVELCASINTFFSKI